MIQKPELSLVLPFYNEEENVERVLKELSAEFKKNKINFEILAVNNGSHDKTSGIINNLVKKYKNIKKVDIVKNIGYGYGILQGLKHAEGKYVGYGWGDGQVAAADFVRVFQNLKTNSLDISKAKRINRDDGLARKIQSKFYNKLMLVLFFINLSDVNGCPKIMRREVYESLKLESKDWFLDPELIIKAYRKKYKIGEVPIKFMERKSGKSKVKLSTSFEFLKNILRYRFMNLKK